MNKFIGLGLVVVTVIIMSAMGCETVKPGHKGVEVSWGGKTNLNVVHEEGMNWGMHWIWDEMVEYDVREQTMVHKFEFNDINNMVTKVEFALDFRLNPEQVNHLHVQITDIETKIIKTLKSAGKEVVPQYSATDLNISKRKVAEDKLADICRDELSQFFVEFKRLQVTDVDIPEKIAKTAEETAIQLERNELAEKKEAEQISLAKAKVAQAEGDKQSAILKAEGKAKAIELINKQLSKSPEYNDYIKAKGYAEHGKSYYGSNNVFGNAAVLKGFK